MYKCSRKELPTDQLEKISAWIDGEESCDREDIEKLLADAELCAAWQRFQLISDCLKLQPGNNIRSTPPALKHGHWLARAAVWLVLPVVAALLWFNHQGQQEYKPLPRDYLATAPAATDPAPAAAGASEQAAASGDDTDMRLDYLIYHSAYLANHEDHAVPPYVRLAHYQRNR